MTFKKIEDMNHYEILNLGKTATPDQIEEAYLLGVISYHPNSLASYTIVSEDERRKILNKLEEAYRTLSNPEKKKAYDSAPQKTGLGHGPRAAFRKSTQKLEIEDASEGKNVWQKFKEKLFPRVKRKKDFPDMRENSLPVTSLSKKNAPGLYRGEYLRRLREVRGLSLVDMARATKISPAVLQKLEEENYDGLPRHTDISGFLRLYALNLGLNPPSEERTR